MTAEINNVSEAGREGRRDEGMEGKEGGGEEEPGSIPQGALY